MSPSMYWLNKGLVRSKKDNFQLRLENKRQALTGCSLSGTDRDLQCYSEINNNYINSYWTFIFKFTWISTAALIRLRWPSWSRIGPSSAGRYVTNVLSIKTASRRLTFSVKVDQLCRTMAIIDLLTHRNWSIKQNLAKSRLPVPTVALHLLLFLKTIP